MRRAALFWVDNGVLLEGRARGGGDVAYARAPRLDPSRVVALEAPPEAAAALWCDDDGAGAGAGAADAAGGEAAAIAAVAPFENFIFGILTNFAAVSLDRLHSLLRVFVVGEPKYDGRVSQEQLGAFMARLVAQGKAEADNGVYRRKKA